MQERISLDVEYLAPLTTIDGLLTRPEVAKRLGVTEGVVDRLRLRLGLPYVKIGNTILFVERQVADWVTAYQKATLPKQLALLQAQRDAYGAYRAE